MEWLCTKEKFWDEYSQEFRCTLWGTESWFHIGYTNSKDGPDCQEQLARFAEAADHCLGWLNVHQQEVLQAIAEDGLYDDVLELIEELKGEEYTEIVEKDSVTYLQLDEDASLPLPYRKEDFFASLVPGGCSFSADFKSTKFMVDLFFDLEPDIYGGHSIEVFLNGDFGQDEPTYSISVNGFAG